jgi:predicted SAM-dependent methyltransferase
VQPPAPPEIRRGEYAVRGDYHRTPDKEWSYYPTYLAKLEIVRRYLDRLPADTRVLDAGCGEGVLIEEYAPRLRIEGVDDNYSSAHVRQGSVLDLPYADSSFDRVLCLDVLEHLRFDEQRRALTELHRVLCPDGELLISVPNLAHLQSRVHFLFRGSLMRTANESKHPGDRPVREYIGMAQHAGFALVDRQGVFPTVPVLTHLIRRRPAQLAWLHRLLTRALPLPGLAFLNLLWFRKTARR